jgi:hypothetical protein
MTDYPACEATYATLCILKDDIDLESITGQMGFAPSGTQLRGGETISERGVHRVPRCGGWFFSSKKAITSCYFVDHLDYVVSNLLGKRQVLDALRADGHRVELFCLWVLGDRIGGGPLLTPEMMRSWVMLDLPIEFDVY